MPSVIDEVRALIPNNAQLSGTGWNNFNCPACGDKRGRGGILFTHSGGFRYRCFNGGCKYEKPTGWEPGNGFGGRPRRLFEDLGGDVRSIPAWELLKWNQSVYDHKGNLTARTEELDVSWKFPSVELPKGSMLLTDAARFEKAAMRVLKYLLSRNPANARDFPYIWSSEYPCYLIIPFLHYHDQIVGYVGRHIHLKTGERRFIGKAPADYVFNQHLLSKDTGLYMFVVESPMDAIPLRCLASRGNNFTEKQINLLRVSGKEIVLIPDFKEGEPWNFYETALKNGWHVSCPEFMGAADICESVKSNGVLLTTKLIMDGVIEAKNPAAALKIKKLAHKA